MRGHPSAVWGCTGSLSSASLSNRTPGSFAQHECDRERNYLLSRIDIPERPGLDGSQQQQPWLLLLRRTRGVVYLTNTGAAALYRLL